MEANEAPDAAATREIREELALDREPGRLLCVDWVPPRESKTDGLMFVFDGGVLDDAATAGIRLPSEELTEHRFVEADALGAYLPPRRARRVAAALAGRATGVTLYLVDGYRPGGRRG